MPRRWIANLRAALGRGLCLGLWGVLCAVAVGCVQSQIAGDGRAPDAPDRIPALVRLAEGGGNTASTERGTVSRDDAQELGELIHSLNDDDPAVRLFAVQGLRERTGLAFGYRYYESAEQRRPAVRAWIDWLDQQAPDPGRQDPASPDPATPDPQSPNTAAAPAPAITPGQQP